jgi:hypothetical protein
VLSVEIPCNSIVAADVFLSEKELYQGLDLETHGENAYSEFYFVPIPCSMILA